jgi:hypothetical protein
MNRIHHFAAAWIAVVGLIAGAIAIAQDSKRSESKEAAEPKLPPGWTQEDLQAMMTAGAPGKMHEHLAKDVGVWHGKSTMWMAPDTEPLKSEIVSTIKPILDGRFTHCEIKGEIPGMGPYHAFGIYGYDNVSKEFVSTWIDNHGTGIMNGTGELSRDGKTMTWKFNYNCPITKKPAVLREVETTTGPKTKTLEAFGAEPKSGKVFKMMSIELTKK